MVVRRATKVISLVYHVGHLFTTRIGDDWDELERKAAKCKFCIATGSFTQYRRSYTLAADLKRADGGKKDNSDSEDNRPKKKKPAANGKSKDRR